MDQQILLCSYNSAMKQNNLVIYTIAWTNLTNIMLNDRSQTNMYMLHNSIYETFQSGQNWSVVVEINGVCWEDGKFYIWIEKGFVYTYHL